MNDTVRHAEGLVAQYRQRRSEVLSKRRKSVQQTDVEGARREENYRRSLEQLSMFLVTALENYRGVFERSIPDLKCRTVVRSRYPGDIDMDFGLNDHSLRFFTRKAGQGEAFQDALVDGILYCESSYKHGARHLEVQAGLRSGAEGDTWETKGEQGEVRTFTHVLPDLVEFLFNKATMSLIHR